MVARAEISVVIPFYNSSRFLADAFATLAGQTFTDFEIIVVDDGSRAEEAKLAHDITAANGARLVRQENAGPGPARNRGAELANGTFIAFLDVDDVWEPEKLARQRAQFDARPELDVVLCESQVLTESGAVHDVTRLSSYSREDLVTAVIFGRINSFTSSIVTRKSFFERVGGFDPSLRFREDHLFLLRALVEGKTAVLPEALSKRRLHLDSTSGVGLEPDLLSNLRRSEIFWPKAEQVVPNLPRRKLRAFEMHRLARHHIVLGQAGESIKASLAAFAEDPSQPRHLAYILAALLIKVQPARFDHWHAGLAQLRKMRVRARQGS